MTPTQEDAARARFADLDSRNRLYLTEDETAALIKAGLTTQVAFGDGKVWFVPSMKDQSGFQLLMKMREA
ncbi:MAG TPA: hypothetical protein VN838_06765 [Bradyrhizobium sp.]|nr:hypothetical protein [Bradyrhizobium sp.]